MRRYQRCTTRIDHPFSMRGALLPPFWYVSFVGSGIVRNVLSLTDATQLISGKLDEVVPPEQSAKILKAVTDAGHIAHSIIFPNEGHHINNAENKITALEAEREWYEKYVLKSVV